MRRTRSLSLVLSLGTILTASSLGALGCSSPDSGVLGGPVAVPAPTTPTAPGNASPAQPSGGGGQSSGTGNQSNNQGGSTPSGGNQGGSTPSGGNQGGSTPSGGNQGGSTPSGGNAPSSDDAGTPPADPDAGSASNGMYDQFQTHNLAVVNMYRATLNAAPLVLDPQLTTFAIAGSLELSQDHSPHQHFINASNNGSIWMDGFNNAAAENQGDPNGWTVLATDPTTNELDQIDAILAAMFAEGPSGGHYQNIMNTQSTRLGVGLLEVSNSLYLTNDFSP